MFPGQRQSGQSKRPPSDSRASFLDVPKELGWFGPFGFYGSLCVCVVFWCFVVFLVFFLVFFWCLFVVLCLLLVFSVFL